MEYEETIVSPEAIEASIAEVGEVQADQAHEAEAAHGAEVEAEAGPEVDGGHPRDRRATALRGTRHRTANLSMGTQVGADGAETGAPAAHHEARVADGARVELVATEAAPLELGPGATPAEDDLYHRVPSGGRRITHRSGSAATPNVSPTMKEDNLFIGGVPDVTDVRQGGLGDCYFLSCLLGMTQNDPATLQSVMSIAGGQVAVTFQRFDARAGAHVPVTIRTGTGLLSRRRHGHVSLVGAGMRIAPAPEKTHWWTEIHGHTLQVHRRDVYETALWAPMMEKAYADFAQRWGSTGRGKDAEERRLGSGYKIIDAGGAVEDCYQLFYGGAATAGTTDINFTPGSNIVTSNLNAIRDLLRYENRQGNVDPGETQRFMHVRIGAEGAVTRGDALIDQVKGLLFADQLGDDIVGGLFPGTVEEQIERLLRTVNRTALRGALDGLQTTLQGFLASPQTATEEDVAAAATPVQTPDLFPHLWDDTMPAPFRHLRENLGILINLGSDSSPGRRMNYTGHAYQIRQVLLADASGAPLALTAADLPARAGDIDAERSRIVLHNPHATNEADLRGTGPADGVDDGIFTYSLDQLLRNFDLLRFADVAH